MSSVDDIVGFFETLVLFRGLCTSELENVARIVQPFECRPGQPLFQQGADCDGMYIIRTGSVVIRARVPGDEATKLARLGPGDMLGEVALLDRGLRTATALAVETTRGYWLGRRHFEILRLDGRPASLVIVQRLIENTCTSVRRSYARIAEFLQEAASLSRMPANNSVDLPEADAAGIPLGSLPFFSTLSPHELQELLGSGRLVHAKRGTVLYLQGARSDEVFIVVRGALRTMLRHGDTNFQIAVHAPGSMVGVLSALDGQPSATSCEACETSTVLTLERSTIEALRGSSAPLSWNVSERIHAELVRELRKCTDHEARLELERHLYSRVRGAINV